MNERKLLKEIEDLTKACQPLLGYFNVEYVLQDKNHNELTDRLVDFV